MPKLIVRRVAIEEFLRPGQLGTQVGVSSALSTSMKRALRSGSVSVLPCRYTLSFGRTDTEYCTKTCASFSTRASSIGISFAPGITDGRAVSRR